MSNSMRNYFRRLAEGYENGPVSSLLTPVLGLAGSIYGAAVTTLRSLYEKEMLPRKRLPFPVISVGNLTWGGSGKTPLVEYLARKVAEHRLTALVLIRGYGSDEVEQLKHHLPRAVIGVGQDRAKVASEIQKKHRIDVAILDDGLQHWPIHRDIEIVTLNAVNPFGNQHLLPMGVLREPVSVLKKAAIVVLSHTNLVTKEQLAKLKEEVRKHAPDAVMIETYLEPLFFYRAGKKVRLSISRLQNQRVTTFSAIASPRTFQLLLSHNGIRPVRNFEFSDHHDFSDRELEEIKLVSQSASAEEIITTEKDFYRSPDKLAKALDPLVLATRLRIATGEELLFERLRKLLGVPG